MVILNPPLLVTSRQGSIREKILMEISAAVGKCSVDKELQRELRPVKTEMQHGIILQGR